MKKMVMAVAIVCATAFVQAATVGWSTAGLGNYVGDKYMVFVLGQNGVESTSTVTALLDAGTDVSSYAFGSGTVGSNGAAATTAGASGKTLDAGTYTSFMVLFDSATPAAGESNYVMLGGTSGQTKVVGPTTSTISFTAGNMSSTANNSANWNSFGSVPEPTSGLLLLLGTAGLALKRKHA